LLKKKLVEIGGKDVLNEFLADNLTEGTSEY
jgi:hypothetical protein